MRETSLIDHSCTQKQRFMARDDRSVNMAYRAFRRFHARGVRTRKVPSYETFARSKYYLGFVRFGRYVLDIAAINPLGFLDFLIRTEAPLDNWLNPLRYETYMRELARSEPPEEAVKRNLMLMEQWGVETGEPWTNFFGRVAPPLAVLWIKSGRLSPWVLFTASSGPSLMQRCTAEQREMIAESIDTEFWKLKFKKNADMVSLIQQTLAEHGI